MTLSTRMLNDVMAASSQDTDIILLTLTHSNWSQPVCLSTHSTTLLFVDENTGEPIYGTVSRGSQFIYVPLQANLPTSSDESPPEAHLTISNVSRFLSPYLKIVDRENPRITIEVVNSATPDIGDVCYPEMEVSNITWDANTVDCTLISSVSSAEPMPWLRFTLSNFPNMQE